MANSFTTNLNMTKPETGSDTDVWGSHLNADLDTLDGIFDDDGTGTAVGINIGSDKTAVINGTLKSVADATVDFLAGTLSIKDDTDDTKVLQLDVSGLTTATTRTLTVPDASDTIVLKDATQTLTNKTLDKATCVGAFVPTGATIGFRGKSTQVPDGWIIETGSIGDASSGATNRADADCEDLFKLLWENANYVVQDSSGSASTKGSTSDDDWTAHKRLVLVEVVDGSGNGRVRAMIKTGSPGSTGGASTHTHSVSGSATGSLSVSVFGSGVTGGNNSWFTLGNINGGGTNTFPSQGHTHNFSVSSFGSTSGSLLVSATAAAASNYPPYLTELSLIKL